MGEREKSTDQTRMLNRLSLSQPVIQTDKNSNAHHDVTYVVSDDNCVNSVDVPTLTVSVPSLDRGGG